MNQEPAGGLVRTVFQVADTGCGMSLEFLQRIRTPFEQERRVASQNGTPGWAQPLSKTLAEKMGGSISVESQLGKGTVFTASIPSRGGALRREGPGGGFPDAAWSLNGKTHPGRGGQ